MLDFYFVADSGSDPEFPVEENYAGSLRFEDVEFLASNAGLRFDYYADVRYSFREVVVLSGLLEEGLKAVGGREDSVSALSACERLQFILRAAVEQERGIVAYGD